MDKTIAVFLSARELPTIKIQAIRVGELLGKKGFHVYYGGGNQGAMGALKDGVVSVGGVYTGVTTTRLLADEFQGPMDPNTTVKATMGERKDTMLYVAGTILLLPGGFGSMDELFEALTYIQLNLIKAKVIIFDPEIEGALKALFRVFTHRGTASRQDYEHVKFVSSLLELERELNNVA